MNESRAQKGCFNCNKKFKKNNEFFCGKKENKISLGIKENLNYVYHDSFTKEPFRQGCDCKDYDSKKIKVDFT